MGNITELSQGSLDGLKKQVCECIEHAQAEGYKKGYTKGKNDGHAQGCNIQMEYEKEKIDKAKQEGYDTGYNNAFEDLKELWECDNIDEFMQYKYQCVMEITYMLERHRPQDVIACFKEWRKQKKQAEEEIKIGDEVQFGKYVKGVIISIKDDWYRVVVDSGFVSSWKKGEFEKTGRNFGAEVSQLLDKLKGDK